MRINQKYALLLSLAVLAVAASGYREAHAHESRDDDAAVSWPHQLRDDMARLAEVEWRLRQAAGALCPATMAATGMKFDYRGAYGKRAWPALEQALGMGALPQVAAVVAGSPAERAGIRVGDELAVVNGAGALDIAADSNDPDLLADELEEQIARLPELASLQLVIHREGEALDVVVEPVALCAARFVIKTEDGKHAYSDGNNIALSTGIIRFTTNDDELALIAGHELGHVVNRDGRAKNRRQRRAMEDAADSLGASLAHCAGYDVSLALEFWLRYRRHDGLRWLRKSSHRSPKGRWELLSKQAGTLACPVTASTYVNDPD